MYSNNFYMPNDNHTEIISSPLYSNDNINDINDNNNDNNNLNFNDNTNENINETNRLKEDKFLGNQATVDKTPTKLGKKRKNDKAKKHTKYWRDNIAKIIKNIFLKALIQFLYLVFNYYLKDDEKDKLIPDKIKTKIKKKNLKQLLKNLYYNEMINQKYSFKVNLEMFDQSIGIIASNNISKKYKNFEKSYNKEIIEQMKKSNKEIDFFLEMTFRDFIDVYLGKK